MGTSSTIDVLFVLLFLFFPIITYSSSDCKISTCVNKSFQIRFPFQIDKQSPQKCGFPGFDLTCNAQNQTVLKLPFSGEFFVRQIIYVTQEILIYDPLNCLPKRLLSFDLSGSPFSAANSRNYTVLRCPAAYTKSRFSRIECLSNSTHSVLATSSESLAASMSASCEVLRTLQVPVSRSDQFEDGLASTLGRDLHLTWYEPDCSNCEIQGGVCGLKSNGSQETTCLYPGKGRFSDGLQIFRIICLSIAVPAVTCAFGIACFACFVDRTAPAGARRSPTAVAAEPEPGGGGVLVTVGLDQNTIESYQKLVLGESRRLPGPNDSTCPICLSEYRSVETLRCIPECRHCFHAECIDEWLRLNGTCPVCRNSLSPSPAHINSDTV